MSGKTRVDDFNPRGPGNMNAKKSGSSKLNAVYKYSAYILSFIITFIVFLRTMFPTTFGYDTTWFHIQVAELSVGQTTGFPLAFLIGKLFTLLPFGTIAYKLNLFSVFWGAATVTVFVMIISNLLKKEYYIALAGTLFFAFFRFFWKETNRFEVYTFHTFLIGLVILFGVYWAQSKKNKFLYLYYLFLGFSLTNHPLSLFLLPALALFPVFIDWREVFKLKKVIIIIAMIACPLLLYLYIPIRSFQGHGDVKTLQQFIDYITGSKWKQQLGFKSFAVLKNQMRGYFQPLIQEFHIPALIVLVIGEVMLFLKNRKYFILMAVLLISYLIPLYLYESSASDFYIIFMITLFIIPFCFGLYYIWHAVIFLYGKIREKVIAKGSSVSPKETAIKTGENDIKAGLVFDGEDKKEALTSLADKSDSGGGRNNKFRIIFTACFFALITVLPVQLFAFNYHAVDKSRETTIYDYWKTVINAMNENSALITSSKSSNVAFYLTEFELSKNVDIKIGLNEKKLMEYVKANTGKKSIYYNQVYLPDLSPYFELKQTGPQIYWADYKENLVTYEILGYRRNVDYALSANAFDLNFGDEKVIYYIIKNHSNTDILKVDSIELKLPKSLKLLGIDETQSDIKNMPGMAKGAFMWTNGPFEIGPSKELKVAVKIKAVAPGNGVISFRLTTMNIYETAPDMKVSVK